MSVLYTFPFPFDFDMIRSHGLLRSFIPGGAAHLPEVSCLFVHANGFCKEVWLPVIDELAEACRDVEKGRIECLLTDLPGHGDRSTSDLGDAVRWISTMAKDIESRAHSHVTSSNRRVGIGMSLGGAALLIAQQNSGFFTDLILLEPVVGCGAPMTKPLLEIFDPDSKLAAQTRKRRNNFSSLAEAKEFFATRSVYSKFDSRCIHQYCVGGLKFSDGHYHLAANPNFESEIYKRFPIFSPEALKGVGEKCRITLVVGADSTFMGGAEAYYFQSGELSSLLCCRDDDKILLDGCSHFAPMERPADVAQIITRVLLSNVEDNSVKSETGLRSSL